MPANNNARKLKEPSTSRPFGSVTRFPGSCVFAREYGCDPSHVFRVLTGKRVSAAVTDAYADFLRKRNVAWPAAAKVQPSKRRAA
jgi:hypothetical protein